MPLKAFSNISLVGKQFEHAVGEQRIPLHELEVSLKTQEHILDEKQKPAAKRGPGRPTLSEEELLDKALDLFLEKGFERTTIEEIAATAGVAKRTIYLRHANKKSLFKAALKRAIEQWIVPISELRRLETDDLEESLQAIGQVLVENMLAPTGLRLLRVTNAESGRMPEIGAYTLQQGTEPTVAYLADLFRRHAAPDGANCPEAEFLGEAFLNLVVGGPANSAAWGIAYNKDEVAQRTRYSIHLLLHGLLPDRESQRKDLSDEQLDSSSDDGSAPASRNLEALQTENRKLRDLLVETMLEAAAQKERLENR